MGPGVFGSAAPSRPPSRASAKLGEQPPGYDDGIHSSPDMYLEWDVDLCQAVSMSNDLPGQADIGFQNPQPSLNNTSTQPSTAKFGPSTRSKQETEGWIIDVATTSTKEIVLTPEAAERERSEGVPTYLRPSPDGSIIPALLKILSSIPMAREALLNRNMTQSDYGFDNEWWNGESIRAQSVHIANPDNDSEGGALSTTFVSEVQRLVAFLADTTRSYGSTDSLSAMCGLKADDPSSTAINFFDIWHRATSASDPDSPFLGLFSSMAKRFYHNVEPSQYDFSVLILKEGQKSLYDIMDNMLWFDNAGDDWEDTVLTDVGHILCLHVSTDAETPCGLKAPSTLFLDRYMSDAAPIMKTLRQQKEHIRHNIDIIKHQREAILSHKTSGSHTKSLDACTLVSAVSKYIKREVDDNSPHTDIDVDESSRKRRELLVSKLDNITQKIKIRLERG